MRNSETFEWFDTGFARRQILPLVIFLVAFLFLVIVTALTGILAERVLIALFTLVPIVIVIGWLAGYREATKRIPTSLGISHSRIRFLYRGRDPKEIRWDEISGIIVSGSWGMKKIVLKDGSTTLLPVPYRIAFIVKERYNNYTKKASTDVLT